MMDIVVAYYRQAHNLPALFYGFVNNADEIGTIYFVNDEPWAGEDRAEVEDLADRHNLRVVLLDHEHDGFGLTKSYNQGVEAAQSEAVLLSQGDIVLPAGFVAGVESTLEPQKVVYAPVIYVEEPFDLETPELQKVIYGDWRQNDGARLMHLELNRHFKLGKGVLVGFYKTDFQRLGGFDEGYAPLGPNSEDHDFAARWVMRYGKGKLSFLNQSLPGWHIGSPPVQRAQSYLDYMPGYDSRARLARTLLRYFNGRLRLFYGLKETVDGIEKDALCVAHLFSQSTDIRLDCVGLEWVDDGTVTELVEILPAPLLPAKDIRTHLDALPRILAPGGQVMILFPHVLHGLTMEEVDQALSLRGLTVTERTATRIIAIKVEIPH